MEVGGMEIEEGFQKLNGKQALQFLRFRKGYSDGDLGRIKVHQKFIDKVINKLLSADFLEILKKGYGAVKTDMSLEEILSYAFQMKEIKDENINEYSAWKSRIQRDRREELVILFSWFH